jgi:hypothetical protein
MVHPTFFLVIIRASPSPSSSVGQIEKEGVA